jgi:predicted flavoprotein YhiN
MPNNTPLDKLIKSVKNNIDSNHRKNKVCSGIYFSVEIMDIDGITGGFNF